MKRAIASTAASSPAARLPAYWLLKSEPADYSIAMLEKEDQKKTCWDGVRNAAARKHLRAMRIGDKAFFYHSSCARVGIAGVVSVCRTAYDDPTDAT